MQNINASDIIDKMEIYDLSKINIENNMVVVGNMNFNGRVPNYIISVNDINILNRILQDIFGENYNSGEQNINIDYNINDVFIAVDKICDYIHDKLNTKSLTTIGNWENFDKFNKVFFDKCIHEDDPSILAGKNLDYVNLCLIFLGPGDCREHQLLLNIMLSLYLTNIKQIEQYKVYSLYTIGIEKKTNKQINHWEHTHPVIHDLRNNNFFSIDALLSTRNNNITHILLDKSELVF